MFTDVLGDEVVLAETVRANILLKHPEVKPIIDKIADVLGKPDQIRRSTQDERAVLYYVMDASFLGGKWIVVVVKQVDRKFISTIYATDKIKSGEVLWKK